MGNQVGREAIYHRLSELDSQQRKLEAERASILEAIDRSSRRHLQARSAAKVLEELGPRLQTASAEVKREVIHLLVERIEIGRDLPRALCHLRIPISEDEESLPVSPQPVVATSLISRHDAPGYYLPLGTYRI